MKKVNYQNDVDVDEFTDFVSKFETGGEPDPWTAKRDDTGVYGKFQISKKWHGKDIEDTFGVPFEEAMAKPENQVTYFKNKLVPSYEKTANKFLNTREAKNRGLDKFTLMALMQFGPTNVKNFLADENSVPKFVSSQIKKVINLGNTRKSVSQNQVQQPKINRVPSGEKVEQEVIQEQKQPELISVFTPKGEEKKIEKDQLDLAKKEGFITQDDLPDMIPMLDPSGKEVKIEKAQLPLALKENFTLKQKEQAAKRQSSVYDLGATLSDLGFSGAKVLATEKLPDVANLFAQGATAGFSDEAIGFLKAAASYPFSDDQLYVLYEKFKKQEKERLKLARERTPVGGFLAETVGSAVPAVLLAAATKGKYIPKKGASLKDIAKFGAKIGAIEGAIGGLGSSEADLKAALTGDKQQLKELGLDVTGGAFIGGAAGGVLSPITTKAAEALPAAKKAVGEAIEGMASRRQSKLAFESKAKDIPVDFETDAGKQALVERQKKFASDVTSQIMGAEETLGKKVFDTVEDASAKRIKIPIGDMDEILNISKQILSKNNYANSDILKELSYFSPGQKTIDPLVFRDLQQSVRKKMSQMTQNTDEDVKKILIDLNDVLTNKLKRNVPGFQEASDVYKLFKESTIETLIARGDDLYRNVKSMDRGRAIENAKRLEPFSSKAAKRSMDHDVINKEIGNVIFSEISNLGKLGDDSQIAARTFEKLKDNLLNFQNTTGIDLIKLGEAAKTAKSIKPSQQQSIFNLLEPNELYKKIREEADYSGIRQKIHGRDVGHGSDMPISEKAGLFSGQYRLERAAGAATRFTRKGVESVKRLKPVAAVRKLTQLSKDKLGEVATGIQSKFPNQAKALLDAIEQNSEYKKNAVIFSLSQNPQFRNIAPMILENLGEQQSEEDYE
jgi:hypothetical protein